jgi:hypothetical protein
MLSPAERQKRHRARVRARQLAMLDELKQLVAENAQLRQQLAAATEFLVEGAPAARSAAVKLQFAAGRVPT